VGRKTIREIAADHAIDRIPVRQGQAGRSRPPRSQRQSAMNAALGVEDPCSGSHRMVGDLEVLGLALSAGPVENAVTSPTGTKNQYQLQRQHQR
jgi:hypothetical protein